MAVNWFRGKEQDPDENQGEFKPEEFKTALAKEFEDKFNGYRTEQEEKMKPLLSMAEQFSNMNREREAAQQRERQNKHTEDNEVTDELWITNPAEAHRRSNAALSAQTQATAALLMRRETLTDKEYYTGALKEEIDALLDAQPLHMRSSTAVINNAYHTILGKHVTEIQEGKIKKQTSAMGFNGSGTGAPQEKQPESELTLSNEEKEIASRFGMSDKDYFKAKQELNYV